VNTRSLEFRLVILYCALLLLLGASFAFVTIRSFERYSHETIVREIAARSGEIWHTARGSLNDPKQLAELLEQRFAPEVQEHFIRITDAGKTLYQSGVPAGTEMDAISAHAPRSGQEWQFGHLLLYMQLYQTAGGRAIAIVSGQSDRFVEGVERSLTQSLLVGLPVFLFLSALGGYFLMRSSLRPIESMIDAAEAITFNNPGNRLPLAHTGDRIEALGLVLNRMLDRLDSAYQFANRFSADAAHELRTPLTIVRGELEFIAGREVPAELEPALKAVLEEVNRLSDIVENLSLLSHMDGIWGKHSHAEFDLYALASETMEQMRLVADEKGVEMLPPTGAATMVAGDRSRLKQVLVNLLDNAFKYTPRGGRVAVDVRPQANRARLSVTDTGIGIAQEHHDKIFRRFYRVSTDRGEIGSGLGLSIVSAICHAHGGSIGIESTPDIGSTLSIELPLSNVAQTGKRNDPRAAQPGVPGGYGATQKPSTRDAVPSAVIESRPADQNG
jgi:two-component system OmpR family sensor kinase